MGKTPTLYSFPSVNELAPQLRTYILEAQKAAFNHHGKFRIAVSGGSLPKTLAQALLPPGNGTPDDTAHFDKWEVFFADERVVPLDHEDSNYRLVNDEWIAKIPAGTPKPTVYPIDPDPPNDEEELADQYEKKLIASFAAKDSVRLPLFDLILLGCGPDGHTCSLFPGHELLRENTAWVAALADSPKPPPKRITLSVPVVTHGLRIAFVATGSGKKEILQKIFDTEEGRQLPCGLINEQGGERVSWFSDSAAVDGVSYPTKSSL